MMIRAIFLLTGFIFKVVLSMHSTVQISKGQVAVLHCENTPGNTNIQWIRSYESDQIPARTYTVGWTVSKALPFSKRVQILGSKTNTNYDLQISDTTEDDAGVYRCIVLNRNPPVEFVVELIVKDPLPNYQQEEKSYTNTTHMYIRDTMQGSGFMLSTLYTILSAVGGCLVCLVVGAVIFILVKQKNGSANIPSTTVRTGAMDVLNSVGNTEPSTAHVYDSPSENGNISFADVTYHDPDVHAHHLSPEASGGFDQPSGLPNAINGPLNNSTNVYYSNPYEPLTPNWAKNAQVYEEGTSNNNPSRSEENKNCQHEYDVCDDIHTYRNTYISMKKGMQNSCHDYN